ncbi:MAG: hypothetical protein ACOCX2_08230 [Armatimonadota bacterium]
MPPRLINACQQVEAEFTKEEWQEFIDRARELFERGEFIHNEFYAKLEEHPEISDADVLNAISARCCLIAYRNEGMERVALWDPRGKNIVVIASLDDGIITAYSARNFDRSLSTRENVRRLWWPT